MSIRISGEWDAILEMNRARKRREAHIAALDQDDFERLGFRRCGQHGGLAPYALVGGRVIIYYEPTKEWLIPDYDWHVRERARGSADVPSLFEKAERMARKTCD